MAVCLQAQTHISVLTGMHVASTSNNVVDSDLINIGSLTNWNIGILMDHNLDSDLMFRTGLKYKQKGFKISESTSVNVLGLQLPLGITLVNQINYIELPLQLKYQKNSIGIQPYFSAGPSVAYATSASVKTRATAILDFGLTDSDLSLGSDDYNRWDILLNAQTGVSIPYGKGHFLAEIGYSHGLNSFTSDKFIIDTGLKNRDWSFSIGYGLRF
jgi:hypothetical protein